MEEQKSPSSGMGQIDKAYSKINVIFITYTIYIVIYETLVIGGCGYITFSLGHSNWWWLLAILLGDSAYSPSEWNRLLTGREDVEEK